MAGGDNGTGGNGSVYWKATHYGPNQQKRKIKVKSGQSQNNDEVDLDQDDALGRDQSTDVKEAGSRFGKTPFPGKGYFRVSLRYESKEEARRAGDWVADHVREVNGAFYLTVDVPAIERRAPRNDQPFEVMVEW